MKEMDNIPELQSIYLNLTNRCNLSCYHCWLNSHGNSGEVDEIEIDAIKNAIIEALVLGLKSVKITGGEPFVRRDILDLITFLYKEDIEITIETNGTLIDQETVDLLKKNDVSLVCVSLDGARSKTHDLLRGVKGSFKKAVEAIRLLSDAQLDVQIITTLYTGNADELHQLFDLAKNLHVKSMSINPLIPSGRGKGMFADGDSLSLKRLIELGREIENNMEGCFPFDVFFSLPLAFKSFKYVRDGNLCECSILNILGILGNGCISICGIGYEEKGLLLGNIVKDSIEEVWKNNPILNSLRSNMPSALKGVCDRCILKGICLGYCRANAYTIEKDLFAPYWFCQKAYEEGLFPSTRLI